MNKHYLASVRHFEFVGKHVMYVSRNVLYQFKWFEAESVLQNTSPPRDRAEKRLCKSMSCGNDCGLRCGLIQNGGLFAGKRQPEFKMKK